MGKETICSKCSKRLTTCKYCGFDFKMREGKYAYNLICFEGNHFCIDKHMRQYYVPTLSTTLVVPKLSLREKILKEMLIPDDPDMILALKIVEDFKKDNPDILNLRPDLRFLNRKELEQWVYNRIITLKEEKELKSNEN